LAKNVCSSTLANVAAPRVLTAIELAIYLRKLAVNLHELTKPNDLTEFSNDSDWLILFFLFVSGAALLAT